MHVSSTGLSVHMDIGSLATGVHAAWPPLTQDRAHGLSHGRARIWYGRGRGFGLSVSLRSPRLDSAIRGVIWRVFGGVASHLGALPATIWHEVVSQ